MLGAFVALVFLMGGGSRDDISSLILLRPAAILFAAYALTVARPGDFAALRVPLLLLLALAGWMLLQLIPLPHAVWSGLPGRAMIAANDQLAGLGEIWRPLTLSPAKTMNSLGSLVVPAAALLLYGIQDDADRRRILPMFMIVAAFSALLGIAQIASGGDGPLYLYATTNLHEVVGLFSNRNHNAVFLATMLVIAGYLFSEHRRLHSGGNAWLGAILIAACCLLVMSTLLINKSRAGLLIGLLAIGIGVSLYVAGFRRDEDGHARPGLPLNWITIAGVVCVSALGAAALFVNAASFDRLVTMSVAEDTRAQVLPQIIAMAQDNWLFGTGFGSFEYVYRTYEVGQSLMPEYLNNAHDDWLQWIIEGGLPAILIGSFFFLWLARTAIAQWRLRQTEGPRTLQVAMALAILLLLLLASALDYPLRVPSMMLYAVTMVALIAQPPEAKAKASRRHGGRG
ncbi:MAG: O-antigen ligase family protein [Sphingomonas sp.]